MATLLLVESEGMILDLIKYILQRAGYETLSAASLAQAQPIIHSDQKIDLVITDINLGEDPEGGIQVGQLIRQFRHGTPVIYTSAGGLTDLLERMFTSPSYFLPKPFALSQVVEVVSEMLR